MKQLKCKVMLVLAAVSLWAWPLTPVAVVGVGVVATGCATNKVAEGSEVFVVRAEQTYKNLDKSFRGFTTFEFNNRAVLQKLSPKIEQAANTVRTDGFNALESLQKATVAYKANRTPENADKISEWMNKIAIVESAIADYQNNAVLTQ